MGLGVVQTWEDFLGESVLQLSWKRSGLTRGREGGRAGTWTFAAEAAVREEAQRRKSLGVFRQPYTVGSDQVRQREGVLYWRQGQGQWAGPGLELLWAVPSA